LVEESELLPPKLVPGCMEMMWLQGFDERRSEDGEFQRGVELGHGKKNGARKTKIITAGYLFEISP